MSTAPSAIQELLREELQLLRDFHRLTQELRAVDARVGTVRSAIEGYNLGQYDAAQAEAQSQ